MQQCERYNLPLINIFINYVAAFDSVERKTLWKILLEDGMPWEFVYILEACYQECASRITVSNEECSVFDVDRRIKQGSILSESIHALNPESDQQTLDEAAYFSAYLGPRINSKKTKALDLNVTRDYQLTFYGLPLEKVDSFIYLGSEMDSRKEFDQDVNKKYLTLKQSLLNFASIFGTKMLAEQR